MADAASLARCGWSDMGTFDEPRLSELARMYEELGYEVRLEPFDPSKHAGCTVCMQADPHRYRTIYTRARDRRNPT